MNPLHTLTGSVCQVPSFLRGVFYSLISSPICQPHLSFQFFNLVSLSPSRQPQEFISAILFLPTPPYLPPPLPISPFFLILPRSALPVFFSDHCPASPAPCCPPLPPPSPHAFLFLLTSPLMLCTLVFHPLQSPLRSPKR